MTTTIINPFKAMARHLFWAVLLLPLLPLAAGCGHQAEGKESKKEEVSKVSTVYPQYQDLIREIVRPAYLRAYEKTPIYSKIGGFAEEPAVDIGDFVKEGQPLVEVYLPEDKVMLKVKAAKVTQAAADLKQSQESAKAANATWQAAGKQVLADKAGIDKAAADVVRWKAELVRAEKNVREGALDIQTKDEIEAQWQASKAARDQAEATWQCSVAKEIEAKAKYFTAEAVVEVADARLLVSKQERDQWQEWLGYSKVTAPYNGVITQRNVHKGHFLQPSSSGSTSKNAEPLFEMVDTHIIRVNVQVPEEDAHYVHVGDTAKIKPQSLPGREFIGKVTRFTDVLDEHARTLRVEVWLDNPTGILRPGMYGNAIILAKVPHACTLPQEALLSDIMANGDRTYCFMVEDGKAMKYFVQTGPTGDEGVQVLRKEKAGSNKLEDFTGAEQVIVTNPAALLDGQPVEVVPLGTKPAGEK